MAIVEGVKDEAGKRQSQVERDQSQVERDQSQVERDQSQVERDQSQDEVYKMDYRVTELNTDITWQDHSPGVYPASLIVNVVEFMQHNLASM